jgi:hypothetical protein
MGVDVDLKPGEPIVAIGNSRVVGIMPNWYAGQPYVALQLLDGPMKGHNYYIAEQITPAVSVGQVLRAGEPIAHYASSGTGIEMGWAGSNWQQTLAQAEGNTGDATHNNAPAGVSFSNFLHSLTNRAPAGSSSAPGNAASVASGTSPPPPGAGAGTAAPGQPQPVAPAGVGPVQPQTAAPTPAPAVGTPAAAGATPAAAGGAAAAAAGPPAAPGGAPIPGTPQFQAVPGKEHHYKLNTVKFLQAVQPAPGSPLAPAEPQAPAGTPGAATPGAPVAGQPVADQLQGQPGTGAPAGTPGVADQALAQAAPAGSVVSVSSPMLTSGQQTFVAHLSSLTGLNTRVVAGWVLAEESGSAAQGREAASNFNWLNIGYFDSGTGAIAHATPFSNPVSAAEQTAKFLKGQWGGASTGIRDILSTVGKPPEDQIMAIANSGWASSHYNNGANLRSTFEELANMKIVTAPPAGAALGAAAAPAPGGVPAAGGTPIPPPGTTIT